jgi:hypothetical protein
MRVCAEGLGADLQVDVATKEDRKSLTVIGGEVLKNPLRHENI